MAEFVGEGFGGLGGVDVVAYPDFAGGEVGESVGAVEVVEGAAAESVAAFAHLPGQGVPQSVGGVAGQQLRPGRLGDGRSVGLGQVEDRHGPEPAHLLPLPRLAVLPEDGSAVVVEDRGAAQDRGQDPQRGFAFADLPAFRLPGPVARDSGGVGALGSDQDHVVERVAVEAAGELQPRLPLLPRLQLLDRLPEPLVQLLQRGRGSVAAVASHGAAGVRAR